MFVCAEAVFPPDRGDLEKKAREKKGLEIASLSERAACAFFGCNVLIESRWLQMQGPSAGDDTSLIF